MTAARVCAGLHLPPGPLPKRKTSSESYWLSEARTVCVILDALSRLPSSTTRPICRCSRRPAKSQREALGNLRLDKIRPSHIQDVLNKMRAVRSPRTCNVALVCLRHVLKAAKRDGYLKTLPTEGIAWQRTDKKARRF